MRHQLRKLVFALLSFAPLAFGGVALADHDDEHHEHEEHEEHEHHERGRGPRIIIAPPVQPYSTPPPGQYAPEDSDRYVPEDSDRPDGYDRYDDRYRRRGPYSEPPPADDYRY